MADIRLPKETFLAALILLHRLELITTSYDSNELSLLEIELEGIDRSHLSEVNAVFMSKLQKIINRESFQRSGRY